MLYPQQNDRRNLIDLSGFWDFCLDPDDVGVEAGWMNGLANPRQIAVPASWNEQFQDTHDYLGAAWYLRRFYAPSGWRGQRIAVRVDSANYAAELWLNGQRLGDHEGGHLPFAFDVTDRIAWDAPNLLAIRVDAELTSTRVPPGNVPGGLGALMSNYPASSFDFFPFGGLQRPVILTAIPTTHITDVRVTTAIDGGDGLVTVTVTQNVDNGRGQLLLTDGKTTVSAALDFASGSATTSLRVPKAKLWGPGHPHLYTLTVTLEEAGAVTDRYSLDVGIRTVSVQGSQILLNGSPIFLTGFGRHEDFPVHGRGLNLPVVIKDHALMQWIGANSYRTSHYPYAEEQLQLADRLGILVIDETPAVGLFFEDGEEGIATRLARSREQLESLIARDKNYACVIAWSVANEPVPPDFMQRLRSPAPLPAPPESTAFFQTLLEDAHRLDATRPATFAALGGCPLEWMALCDIVLVNRYFGWYSQSGQLDIAEKALEQELDMLDAALHRPIVISEFGADTLPGCHADPPTLWSEEYQVEFLRRYLDVAARKPYVAGLHVWNLADFKTAQAIMRAGGLNHKGVFTRDRQPKMAAHFLRSRWSQS
ncbi:MAG: beta-glucuronidase [Caldilinea sp.]